MGALCCCLKSQAQPAAEEKRQESAHHTIALHHSTAHHSPCTHHFTRPPLTHRAAPSHLVPHSLDRNHVSLSPAKASTVIVTAPSTVSGTGTILGNSQLLQNKTYFEVHLLTPATFSIGLTANTRDELDKPLHTRPHSYALSSERITPPLQPNDIVGVYYDLSGVKAVLSFSRNGVAESGWSVVGVKGDVYPAVSVAYGTVLRLVFKADELKYGEQAAAGGFEAAIRVRSVM